MGYYSKTDAESVTKVFIASLEDISKCLKMNFEEMDFENADKRKKMKTIITDMREEIELSLKELKALSFES